LKIERAKIIPLLLAIIAAGGAALVLFFFAPERHAFYPRCLFHALTGLQCPGCGSLRAAHCLLHGDLAGAFQFNPLMVTLAPLITFWIGASAIRQATGRKTWHPFGRPIWAWALLAIGVAFGIIRNLSW